MRTSIRTWAVALAGVATLLMTACSTDSTIVEPKERTTTAMSREQIREMIAEKSGDEFAREFLAGPGKRVEGVQVAITYMPVCDDDPITGDGAGTTFGDAATWHYYKFYGTAGDEVTISVTRTGCGIDPALSLYEGTVANTDDLYTLTFLAFADDNMAAPCGWFGDPYLGDFVLPSTGEYTLAVYNYLGSGGDMGYSLTVSGATPCDSDGDGVADIYDDHPFSNQSEYVVIDGCDSGVENVQVANGSNMMDLIGDCAANAVDHGGFVSCVTQQANSWKTSGLITGAQKGSITSCAARANIP